MLLECMLACMVSANVAITPTPTAIPTPTAAPVVIQAQVEAAKSSPILAFVNNERVANGDQPLVENAILDKSAMDKACDMRDRNYWSHQDPQGQWSWHYFYQEGWHSGGYLGEDMGRNYFDDQQLVTAWMNSPKHKEVMLDPVYTNFGFARCGIYEVAHFAGH